MDSEYILRLLEMFCTKDVEADLQSVLALLEGSFSLGILLPNRLIAIRDERGCRPLSIGKFREGAGYCISSENCVFPSVGANYIQDVEAGTMVFVGPDEFRVKRFAKADEKKCRFESIYFSHPASTIFGEGISKFRIKLGRMLEKNFPVIGADIVTPVPDSSNFIAIGYSESKRSGIYFPIITRNHYVGRTFIAAPQAKRDEEVSQKFTFTAEEIIGKKIVVVDDSIVRGTTLPKIIDELRQLGAKEVHARIGCPPIKYPCTYGVNMRTSEELIATHLTKKDICSKIGADSLEFLPLEVLKTLSPNPEKFCFACMTGEYW